MVGRKLALAIALSIIISTTSTSTSGGTASASPEPKDTSVVINAEEALRKDAQVYAEAFEVTVDEAIRRSEANKNQDFAWYFNDSHVYYAQFWDGSQLRSQTAQKSRSYMEDYPVCHYGWWTGHSCGMATHIHYAPSPNVCNGQVCDAVWLLVEDSGALDIDCHGGDSGGPYFWGNAAWATHTAGANVGGPDGPCAYTVAFTLDGLTWDGVNTRLYLP